jgi:hypothetical protein
MPGWLGGAFENDDGNPGVELTYIPASGRLGSVRQVC